MKRTLYCVIEVDQAALSYDQGDYQLAFHMMLGKVESEDDPWMLKDVMVYDSLAILNEDHLLPVALGTDA